MKGVKVQREEKKGEEKAIKKVQLRMTSSCSLLVKAHLEMEVIEKSQIIE